MKSSTEENWVMCPDLASSDCDISIEECKSNAERGHTHNFVVPGNGEMSKSICTLKAEVHEPIWIAS